MVQMNPIFYIVCIGILLASGLPGLASGLPFLEDENTTTATVHGVTYAWDTLEPINDTVIEVNSTPPQSIVAKDGMYSFELMPGDYAITASYYQNNTPVHSMETTIKIEDDGCYVLDLLLYPVSENTGFETIGTRKNQNEMNPPGQTETSSSTISYLPAALSLIVLFVGSYKLSKKHRKTKENTTQKREFKIHGLLKKIPGKTSYSGIKQESRNPEKAVFVSEPIRESGGNPEIETSALKKQPLSAELSETLDIIRGNKGRITQKDLRGKLKYSEVKVSLMLSELEKRGLIKKFKNGRENIVVLTDEEP